MQAEPERRLFTRKKSAPAEPAAKPAPPKQTTVKSAPKQAPVRSEARPAPAKPAAKPASRPAPAATPGVRKEDPKHPKAVRYTEVSDEDFFGKFNPPEQKKKAKADEDGPLTLDDIFGDNGLFTDDRKGGKR